MTKKEKKSASTETEKINAKQLIQLLDKYAKKFKEVALVTSFGEIYAWQKHKLENLKFAIAHRGEIDGFIALSNDADRIVLVPLGPEGERVIGLSDPVESVWQAYDDGYREDPDQRNERFLDEHKFCSECGQDNIQYRSMDELFD